jgi:hypothetical protein
MIVKATTQLPHGSLMFRWIALFSLALNAQAEPQPPLSLELESYRAWLEKSESSVSPFLPNLFSWNMEQESLPLPEAVANDPKRVIVTVQRPLAETDQLEASGEIEEARTIGFETYGEIDASVELVLETLLFRSGKPVGLREGTTYPIDSIFGSRRETIRERWGASNYFITNQKTGGGFVRDQNDSYSTLVRGNAQEGFVILSSFFAPIGPTETQSALTFVRLRPLPGGKTDYRTSARFVGQSYGMFGKNAGRASFGFNATRIRQGQIEFFALVKELKDTGRIPERRR